MTVPTEIIYYFSPQNKLHRRLTEPQSQPEHRKDKEKMSENRTTAIYSVAHHFTVGLQGLMQV
jgi:hypothetical protein